MNNEKLILRSLKYILLKWGSTDVKATEIILDINKALAPKEEKIPYSESIKETERGS